MVLVWVSKKHFGQVRSFEFLVLGDYKCLLIFVVETARKRRKAEDWVLLLTLVFPIYVFTALGTAILVNYDGKYHYHTAMPFEVPFVLSLALLAMEYCALGFGICLWTYMQIVVTLFFQHCRKKINDGKRIGVDVFEDVAVTRAETLRRVEMLQIDELKRTVLTLTYYNRAFAMPIFMAKVMCLIDGVWGTFTFIKYISSQLPPALQ